MATILLGLTFQEQQHRVRTTSYLHAFQFGSRLSQSYVSDVLSHSLMGDWLSTPKMEHISGSLEADDNYTLFMPVLQ